MASRGCSLTPLRSPNIIKGMSIWNKVLIGFILVLLAVFFYEAARALKTHQYWRNTARVQEFFLQKELANQEALTKGGEELTAVDDQQVAKLRQFYKDYGHSLNVGRDATWPDFTKAVVDAVVATGRVNMDLLEACAAEPQKIKGIQWARLELHNSLIGRGRVWFNCSPQRAATGVTVTTDRPDPHGIADKTILSVFEENDIEKKGSYLGEFKVVGVDAKTIALEPTRKMNERELARLNASKGPWTLYEDLPTDDHAAFAELDEAKKKEMLPAASLAEYIKDGAPAAKDDPEECKAGGKYVRKLRDYGVLFERYHVKRSVLADVFASNDDDLKYVTEGAEDAKALEQFAEKQVATAKEELAKAQKQSQAVRAHRVNLAAKLGLLQSMVSELAINNRKLVSQLQRAQVEMAERINARASMLSMPGPRK